MNQSLHRIRFFARMQSPRRNRGLTLKRERIKIEVMEAERSDKPEESANQEIPEPRQDIPLSELRDLRPERDPMGAGSKGSSKTRADQP